MKKLVLKRALAVAVLTTVVNYVFAVEPVKVPQDVETAFAQQFAGVRHIKWMLKNGNYEVIFKMKGEKIRADFDADGELIETRENISVGRIPTKIKQALHSGRYAAYHIDNVSLVITPTRTVYQLHVDNHDGITALTEGIGGTQDYKLTLDAKGGIIKRVEL